MSRSHCHLVVAGLLLTAAVATASERFVDSAADRGLSFQHQDYRTGEKYYVETTGSGGGFLDFDADGDLDIYLLQGAPPPGSSEVPASNALFENREGRFFDITRQAGVEDSAFGMGLCVGDIDADGWVDFMVTNYGPDRLYRNRGDGTFDEVAEAAGIHGNKWSSSCAFGDVDGDGDHDLYVTHYIEFDYNDHPDCGDRATRQKYYCLPSTFSGVQDSLFINRGDGTFRDEGMARGLQAGVTERGLGVLLSDLDDDGDLDIYVANDGSANRFYVNQGDGVFVDEALTSGLGVNAFGRPEASMGIAAGDLDGDERDDLVLTHFAMETNTLYLARGAQQYDDRSRLSGVGPVSLRMVSWGVTFFDADSDGDLDLAIANGHIEDDLQQIGSSLAYEQPKLLLQNRGDGSFVDVSAGSGEVWSRPRVGRGLARGDFNNDGRPDLLVTNINGDVELLENRWQTSNHWLGLELTGPPSNPMALGTVVRLVAGERAQRREIRSGGSFQSQSDLRPLFGLGDHSGPVQVEIRWPDGSSQSESTSALDRYWPIRHRSAGPR